MQPPYEPTNSIIRTIFRVAALILLPLGVIFSAVGILDFFSAFSGHGFPTRFWCVFVGFPMLGLGTFCFKAGFLRTISGYIAGEAAPVAKDTIEYIAQEMRPTIRAINADIHETGDSSDPAERLKQLESLKTEGLISEQEYSDKRAKILNEI